MLGLLKTEIAVERPDLVAAPVLAALLRWPALGVADVLVAPIDPELADTAAFCAAYEVGLDVSANCVIIAGKRDGEIRYAACMILATTRADVNGVVRRHLEVRKASFAPMAEAVELTGMEYGGITPIGLPAQWPILVDAAVAQAGPVASLPAKRSTSREDLRPSGLVVIGSGLRASKIVIPGAALAALPGAVVIPGLANPVPPAH